MTIDKLSRFIATFTSSALTSTSAQRIAQESDASGDAAQSEAVTVANDFGASREAAAAATDDGDAAHKAKLARLTDQVRSGNYRPDPNAVAEAVARELFI